MKKTFLLFSLCMLMLLPFTHAQKTPAAPDPLSGRQKITLLKNHRDYHPGLKEVQSEKWNDSIIWYNWNPLLSDWLIDVREFRTRSPHGFVASRLYLRLDTLTHQWGNIWLDEMDYFGTSGDNLMTSYKIWDAPTSSWIQYFYHHYLYPGKEDEYIIKNWNAVTRKFNYGYWFSYQYDLNGNQTEELDQELDTETSLWINDTRYSSTYNANLLTEDITMFWDTATNAWENAQKTTYSYDAGNFLIRTERYSWYFSTWNLENHSLYTYNVAGLPVERIDENWNGSSWDSAYRVQYTYDATGTKLLTKLECNYKAITHTWINNSNQVNTYFTNGDLNSVLLNLWNTNTNSWMERSFIEYDASGNKINTYYRYINPFDFTIINGLRYNDTYDVNGRFMMEIRQNLDTATNTLINYSKYQYTYEDPINSYWIEELGSLWDGSTWVYDYKDIFFWSYPSGIGDVKNQPHLCYFENPMEPGKPINCPFLDPSKSYQFDLFTIKGDNVYSETINSGTSFIISRSFVAGMYILRISEKGKTVFSDKVVVIN